jgi:hypothetical protein
MQKIKPLRNKKYVNSFKIEGEHYCILTDTVMPDGSHIRYGWGGMGYKPPDDRIIPLKHELHMEQHKIGEVAFWHKYFYDIPEYYRMKAHQDNKDFSIQDDDDLMDRIKLIANIYYSSWVNPFS